MDLKAFAQAIQQIADEKGISREKIIETIEMALAAAYKRDYGKRGQIIRAHFDSDTGTVSMRQIKIVVDQSMLKFEGEADEDAGAGEKVFEAPGGEREEEQAEAGEKKIRFNSERHLMIDEARGIRPDVQVGDELEFSLEEKSEFGRIAAQTAKQVIIQRIREAEREAVYDEYKSREGELVSGLIQRIEGRNVFMDLGKTVGVLPPEEQIPHERFFVGERIKVLIVSVEKNVRGSGVFLSRTHPRLLKKLFELEVPEIGTGAVEIKVIAREPGSRAKVAVTSHEQSVDPVGSLVGQKGVRVSTVIQEIGGEKIDIIEWSDNAEEFVANALSPAKVVGASLRPESREALVTVPEDQLSLAIGRAGQNVRLAAKLTGWRIDVRGAGQPPSETESESPAEDSQTPDSQGPRAPDGSSGAERMEQG